MPDTNDWRTGRHPLTAKDVDVISRWWWRKGGRRFPMPAWLDSNPSLDEIRANLVRVVDREGPAYPLAKAYANFLDVDPHDVLAENYPRKAAKYAAECRERGDDPHADMLQAALIAHMFCANCGRPLVDPLSIGRGIGPDCWGRIEPEWRASIQTRMEVAA